MITSKPLPSSLDKLHQRVTEFYVCRNYERGREGRNFDLTEGAVIAHLRHCYTNYETLLSQIEGQPGCTEVYPILKGRCTAVAAELLRRYEVVSGETACS